MGETVVEDVRHDGLGRERRDAVESGGCSSVDIAFRVSSRTVNFGLTARAVVTHRSRYPALRLRPLTQKDPKDALVELGFPLAELEQADTEYAKVKPRLFAELLERAECADSHHVSKLRQPDHYSHQSKRLIYLAVRALQPAKVVETGTYAGVLSTFILQSFEDNGGNGELLSFDLPAYQPLPGVLGTQLPAGHDSGWIIPDRLRERIRIVQGDAKKTLPEELGRFEPIDLFVHDSDHSYGHMMFEFRRAWPALRGGGILVSDDIFDNAAYWAFTTLKRLPFVHIGNVGITRKPH
jgi:predicted O-methyltransferase YrrM